MMNFSKFSRGYTLVELIAVVAIISILMVIIIPSFTDFRRNSQLNVAAMNLVTLLNKARTLSISGKNDTQYGVHLEASKAVLYRGATYVSNASTNETYSFDSGLSLSSITINGGGSEVLFDRWTGATNNDASMVLSVTGTSKSTTLLVRNTGIITPN
jgi:prepilin-type N-terminal cleavage/methylation domain-containing protein